MRKSDSVPSIKKIKLKEEVILLDYLLANPDRCNRKDIILDSKWGITKTENLLKKLISQGFLFSKLQANNGRGKGRKQLNYEINPEIAYFIGIESSGGYDRFVLTDFCGKIVCKQQFPSCYLCENFEDAMKDRIDEFIAGCSVERSRIAGIGIGLQGIFNETTGYLYKIMDKGENFNGNIKNIISEKLNIHVSVSHSKYLLLYDRYRFNQSRVGNHLLSVSLGFGIGLSLFVNGSFIQGANGLAGEIGHTVVPDNKKKCYCGKEGCLRTLLSYRGIIDEVLSRLQAGFSTNADVELIKTQEPEQAVEHIIDMALEKDPICMRVIHETGKYLGISLANAVMLLNPDVLLINSNLTRAGETFTASLRFHIENNALPPIIKDLKIEFSLLNPYSVARGGAVLSQKDFMQALRSQ